MSSINLYQTFDFYLTLLKIFSSKAAIKGTAYGGGNLLFREFVFKFHQKIQKYYSLMQV